MNFVPEAVGKPRKKHDGVPYKRFSAKVKPKEQKQAGRVLLLLIFLTELRFQDMLGHGYIKITHKLPQQLKQSEGTGGRQAATTQISTAADVADKHITVVAAHMEWRADDASMGDVGAADAQLMYAKAPHADDLHPISKEPQTGAVRAQHTGESTPQQQNNEGHKNRPQSVARATDNEPKPQQGGRGGSGEPRDIQSGMLIGRSADGDGNTGAFQQRGKFDAQSTRSDGRIERQLAAAGNADDAALPAKQRAERSVANIHRSDVGGMKTDGAPRPAAARKAEQKLCAALSESDMVLVTANEINEKMYQPAEGNKQKHSRQPYRDTEQASADNGEIAVEPLHLTLVDVGAEAIDKRYGEQQARKDI